MKPLELVGKAYESLGPMGAIFTIMIIAGVLIAEFSESNDSKRNGKILLSIGIVGILFGFSDIIGWWVLLQIAIILLLFLLFIGGIIVFLEWLSDRKNSG